MDLRGAEENRVVATLSRAERARLAALLKTLTLVVERS
jgi:hypothetical protein